MERTGTENCQLGSRWFQLIRELVRLKRKVYCEPHAVLVSKVANTTANSPHRTTTSAPRIRVGTASGGKSVREFGKLLQCEGFRSS